MKIADVPTEPARYKIETGSVSGHECCFVASIIDVKNPQEPICECATIEYATIICHLLNCTPPEIVEFWKIHKNT